MSSLYRGLASEQTLHLERTTKQSRHGNGKSNSNEHYEYIIKPWQYNLNKTHSQAVFTITIFYKPNIRTPAHISIKKRTFNVNP